MNKPVIAVTMGDPGGIGPEVAAKALADFRGSDRFRTLLVGSRAPFDFLRDSFGLNPPLHLVPAIEPALLRSDRVNFLDVSDQIPGMLEKMQPGAIADAGTVLEYGKIHAGNAALALGSLKVAAHLASAGLVHALVTAPVNKAGIRLILPGFTGHTEYLAEVSRSSRVAMMFVGSRFRVTLVTIHVALKDVSRLLTKEAVLEKIRLTDEFLKQRLGLKKPKIAVAALNPHGGETGTEEKAVIEPAVIAAQKNQVDAHGPYPADVLFYEADQGRWDAVVAMYHDQALAPFKMVSFHDGVNVTLGLPFVRTSPDHGTAYGIAYQNKADASSMKAALARAAEWVAAAG